MKQTLPMSLCVGEAGVSSKSFPLDRKHLLTEKSISPLGAHPATSLRPGDSMADTITGAGVGGRAHQVAALPNSAPSSRAVSASGAVHPVAAGTQPGVDSKLTASQLGELDLARQRAARAASGRPQRKRGRSPPPPPSSQGQATNGSGSGCGQLTSSDRVEQGERAGSSRSVRLNGYQRSGMATARAGNGNASGPVSEDIDDDDDLSDGMRGGEGTGHTKGLDKDARSLRRLLRNRVSAQQARERKKAYVTQLEDQVRNQDARIRDLESMLASAEARGATLSRLIQSMRGEAAEPDQNQGGIPSATLPLQTSPAPPAPPPSVVTVPAPPVPPAATNGQPRHFHHHHHHHHHHHQQQQQDTQQQQQANAERMVPVPVPGTASAGVPVVGVMQSVAMRVGNAHAPNGVPGLSASQHPPVSASAAVPGSGPPRASTPSDETAASGVHQRAPLPAIQSHTLLNPGSNPTSNAHGSPTAQVVPLGNPPSRMGLSPAPSAELVHLPLLNNEGDGMLTPGLDFDDDEHLVVPQMF